MNQYQRIVGVLLSSIKRVTKNKKEFKILFIESASEVVSAVYAFDNPQIKVC